MLLKHAWPTRCTELPAKCATTHPSVTDPVASIFSPAFLEKMSRGRQLFHQVSPFCNVALLPFSEIHKWYMLVRKSSTWGAINWPGKLKILPGSGRANLHWVKGKNPLGRVSLGLLQRDVTTYCNEPASPGSLCDRAFCKMIDRRFTSVCKIPPASLSCEQVIRIAIECVLVNSTLYRGPWRTLWES